MDYVATRTIFLQLRISNRESWSLAVRVDYHTFQQLLSERKRRAFMKRKRTHLSGRSDDKWFRTRKPRVSILRAPFGSLPSSEVALSRFRGFSPLTKAKAGVHSRGAVAFKTVDWKGDLIMIGALCVCAFLFSFY